MGDAGDLEGTVLFINDAPVTSGVGRYSDDLLKSVREKGNMISFVMDKRYIKQEFPGIKKIGFFLPFMEGGWGINNLFSRLIFRKEFSAVRNELISGGIVHYTNPQIKPLKHSGKKVVTIHDLFLYNDKNSSDIGVRKALIKNIDSYREFDNIITISKTMENELKQIGFNGNITVIYPPVSETFTHMQDRFSLRHDLHLPENKKLILSVSTTAKRKNIKTVLQTMKILGGEYMLVRIGEDIGTGITFKNVSSDKLNKIYNACDALLFPTLGEGFGYPAVEAMATGLPVVASNIDVLKETTGNAAVLTNPTPEECAEGLKEALNNKEKYSEIGIKRSEEFSFKRFKEEINRYYSELLN